MRDPRTCPDCGSSDLHSHGGIPARGGYGPDLLPGLSRMFTSARMRAVVCRQCGLVRFYVAGEDLKRVNRENGWSAL